MSYRHTNSGTSRRRNSRTMGSRFRREKPGDEIRQTEVRVCSPEQLCIPQRRESEGRRHHRVHRHFRQGNRSAPAFHGHGKRSAEGPCNHVQFYLMAMRNHLQSLLIILAVVCATSCVTRRACDRRFPPVTTTSASTITEVYIRDTVVKVVFEGAQLMDSSELKADANIDLLNRITADKSILRTGPATSEAWVADGRMYHRLQQRDTAIDVTLKGALQTLRTHEQVNTTVERPQSSGMQLWERVTYVVVGIVVGLVAGGVGRGK